jgi:2-polyprenyl-3-methyl-5-hydroxy-6-metoxy-1,4-benzoquinol methylase
LFEAPGQWNLKKCRNASCRLIWMDPAPLAEDLHLAYATYFTHSAQKGQTDGSARLRLFLYAVYRFSNSVAAAVLGLRRYKRKMETMYLDEQRPGKVLDVGCGDGKYLNRMRSLGWEVDGVDFDAKAIETAKAKYGLELRHGSLQDQAFADGSFDAVTMSHSIEHVPDPIAQLAEAACIVKPGGWVVVTTPNSESFGHERFGCCWLGLDPPRHVHVFTLNSLRACAERAGLKIVQALSSPAGADVIIGGSYALREVGDHRGSTLPRPNINVSRALKASVMQYREMLRLERQPNCGEEAVLICAK